jgi:hypothetical protein
MSAVLATSGQFGGFNSYAEWFNSKFSNTSSFFVDLKDRFNQTLALFNPNIQSTIRANLNIAIQQFQQRFPTVTSFNDPGFALCRAESVRLSDILIDVTMQRQLDISWVYKILMSFRPWQVMPIQVYKVDPLHTSGELNYLGNGLYASWDGQHTAVVLWVIAVLILKLDPRDVWVPVAIYSVKSKAEIRANFLNSNTPEGKNLLDEIDIFQQKVFGARIDGATDPDWVQCEQKQQLLEASGLFLTADKFQDSHHVGAITRVKDVVDRKVSVELVRQFCVYATTIIGLDPRPINTKELPIIMGYLKMAESAGVHYSDAEISHLAALCYQLFGANFDSDGPFWRQLESSYNNWWMNYYANVHISLRPAQPRMNKDWTQGGTFFWHQLRKSWVDQQGNPMRMPQLNISTPFIPDTQDLF